jgi:hypothetical protein
VSLLRQVARQGSRLPGLNGRQRTVLCRIADCRTEAMGGNLMGCACGHQEMHWNSCRDRHCPLCQGAARARWVASRLTELLPCPYFHVVFTVPHELTSIALANKALLYQLLFRSVHATLLEVGANPENLGGRLGGLSVLHTWNQKLAYHPHVHCIVPGGGISPEGDRWITGKPGWFLPVRRLSMVFRGKLLSGLSAALSTGQLFAPDPEVAQRLLGKAAAKDFVVYAKPPFGGPVQVLKYLGRYTHRVGISEQRMVALDGDQVRYAWLNRASGHSRQVMSLPLPQFIDRFLLHLLPKGIRKIRYFGYFANRDRGASLALARALIEQHKRAAGIVVPEEQPNSVAEPTSERPPPLACPKCRTPLRCLASDRTHAGPGLIGKRLLKCRRMLAANGADPPGIPEPRN